MADKSEVHQLARGIAKLIALFLVLMLTSCARPGPSVLALANPAPGAKQVSILVATNRTPDAQVNGAFTAARSYKLHYLEVIVSIPPGHKPPSIEWPRGKPNPMKSFAVVSSIPLTGKAFLAKARDSQKRAEKGRVGLFLHGYNYSYQEALFRLAQMSSDSGVGGIPILFDWPSQAKVSGYIADKDSATFSRDDLTHLLTDLGRAGIRTTVLAHSMGSWLAMEAMRQLSLTGQQDVIGTVDQMVLAAPDIDIDVLRKQLASLPRLRNPIVLLTAKDDRALALSRRLAGSLATAGSLDVDDPRIQEFARKDRLTIVDISNLPTINGSNHDRFIALASAYPQLSAEGRRNPVAGAGALVLGGVGTAISAPFRLGSSALGQ